MSKKKTYGGIVFDEFGYVLLREPKDHYGGYVWTFPKGAPTSGESPERAALRRVLLETGVEALIEEPIPGVYEGDTSISSFFLMSRVRESGCSDSRTQSIKWVKFLEAPSVIRMTENLAGRHRDLAVLGAALQIRRELMQNGRLQPEVASPPPELEGICTCSVPLPAHCPTVVALLGQGDESTPVAYAIVSDVPPDTQTHFRKHEGIEILSYDTKGRTDFSGFDDYLSEIHQSTNPLVRFGLLFRQRRILWIDPHPENNEEAFVHLKAAADAAKREREPLVMVDTADEGVAAIESGVSQDRPFDLVITHWGHNAAQTPGGLQCPTAVGFLSAIRSRDLRCPVIVFASEIGAPQRKLTALGLGALAYCFDFSSLYRTIEDALSPGE